MHIISRRNQSQHCTAGRAQASRVDAQLRARQGPDGKKKRPGYRV